MTRTFTAIAALAITSILAISPIIHFTTMEDTTVTVTGKYRNLAGNASRFMVDGRYPDGDVEVFENVDSWLALKFDSADVQARMMEGDTCDLTVNGFRVRFLSMNRNILSAECK